MIDLRIEGKVIMDVLQLADDLRPKDESLLVIHLFIRHML